MEVNEIRDALSIFADYLDNFKDTNKELEIATIKIKEAVFWLTYSIEDDKEV